MVSSYPSNLKSQGRKCNENVIYILVFYGFSFCDFFSLYKGEKVAQKEKLKKEYYYRTNSNTLFLSSFWFFFLLELSSQVQRYLEKDFKG